MRKSDKKLDNQLTKALTQVCESALKDINGFNWLTHLVNYNNFPKSLKIVCVFDSDESLKNYLHSSAKETIQSAINAQFKCLDIKLSNIKAHILYDTEEQCLNQHQGHWGNRLSLVS
ncbi:Fis family transcriptional regulator [Thalassotalea sp. PLHSN55]|uniref:Fis family transcriptional regulator n=1 Tax=Thalassotalea sp. PLHSN55 TaxID=3435888 RepID=UPI003F83B458